MTSLIKIWKLRILKDVHCLRDIIFKLTPANTLNTQNNCVKSSYFKSYFDFCFTATNFYV